MEICGKKRHERGGELVAPTLPERRRKKKTELIVCTLALAESRRKGKD